MTLSATVNGALRNVRAWPLYGIAATYAAWEFWRAVNQQGPYLVEPINVLERTYGEIALILLVAGLLVTPLRQWTGVNLIKIRKMGAAAWRQLHKLSYVAVILGALHYLWLSRGFQVEPLVYLMLSIGLVALRYRHVAWRKQAA